MKKMIVILGMVALMAMGATYVYAVGPSVGPGQRTGWG